MTHLSKTAIDLATSLDPKNSPFRELYSIGGSLKSGAKIVRILGWIWLILASLSIVSCSTLVTSTPSPTPSQTPTPLPLPSSTPTLVPSPTSPATLTPLPTLAPLVVPTPPPGGLLSQMSNDPDQTGWFGSRDIGPHWRERNLVTGIFQGQSFISIVQFDATNLPPVSRVLFAALEITGRDATNLGTTGEWFVDLIDSRVVRTDQVTFDSVRQAPTLATLGGPFSPQVLGAGVKKRFILTTEQQNLLQKQLDLGKVTIRVRGPISGGDNLFAWDGTPGLAEPTLYLSVIPAPFVVITNTPAPVDVFAAATRVIQQTLQARAIGTPTPLPRSYVTATPQPGLVVVTDVPTLADPVAARATAVYETAVAVTTGTATPRPPNWITATPRPLVIPQSKLTAVPSPTPTIALPTKLQLAAMPLPPGLDNKIIFLEGPRLNPNVWIMDPDGTNVGLVTDRRVYDIAEARDTIGVSYWGPYHAYNADDRNGILQIWAQDLNFPEPPYQLSFLRRGYAWGPAWSPDGLMVAYVSGEPGPQEIIVHTFSPDRKNLSWKQLTFSSGYDWHWNQHPSWSPDGKRIVYSSDRGHNATFSEIWIMDADGNNQHNIGNGVWDTYMPVWIKGNR